jgi:hypothetical protein
MNARRRRLSGGRARFGFGRPVRSATLLGSLLAWAFCGCSQPGSWCGCAAPVHTRHRYRRPNPQAALGCVHIRQEESVATRVGIRELRSRLASHLESSTPIEVTRHGRTIGLYVPLPQQGNLSDRDKVLEAGRLMQAELERLGLGEDELSADFRAWRKGRHEQATA